MLFYLLRDMGEVPEVEVVDQGRSPPALEEAVEID
jgi:hypothetical protein